MMGRCVGPLMAAWFCVGLVCLAADWFEAAALAGPRPCDAQSAPAPAVKVEELPVRFGVPTRFDDIRPGEWFWVEAWQGVYLMLADRRYCDPATGEHWTWEPGHGVGWPVRAEVRVVRPNSLDVRPWHYPERER